MTETGVDRGLADGGAIARSISPGNGLLKARCSGCTIRSAAAPGQAHMAGGGGCGPKGEATGFHIIYRIVRSMDQPTFRTSDAEVSPAAHPVKRTYPPPRMTASSIPSIMDRPAVGAWGWPNTSELP